MKNIHFLAICGAVLGVLSVGVATVAVATVTHPYFISVTSNSVSGLTLNIGGNASSTNFAGNLNAGQQNVGITWGDGSSTDPISNFVITTSTHDTFFGTWADSHTYATPGTYTVIATVYHAQGSGHDGSATASTTFTAVINPTIVATAGAGGTITPVGTTTVTYGANQTFSISANSGYNLATLTIDGVATTTTSSYTFSHVIANHTIAATFSAVPNPTIVATAGTGGTITPVGTTTVTYGNNQTFAIAANSGYNLATLTIDGVGTTTTSSYTFSHVTANHTIAATFSAAPTPTSTLAVSVNGGTGGGVVSSTPGTIYCDSANSSSVCSNVFTVGTGITLFASPDASSTFTNWNGGPCASATSTSCSFAVTSTAPMSTIAVFTLIPPTPPAPTTSQVSVTIMGTGSGSVSSNPSGINCSTGTCSASFNNGSTTVLTAVASGTDAFTGWTGAVCNGSTSTTCSFTVSTGTAVTATFDTTGGGGGGGGTPTSTPTSSTPTVTDLSITKTASVTSTTPGGTIDYHLTVTNNSTDTAYGVVANDLLPSGLNFVSSAQSVGNYDSLTGIWLIGDMAGNATATLDISTTAATSSLGSIDNTATVTEGASSTDPNTGNNSFTASVLVIAAPTSTPTSTPSSTVDLAITKTVDNTNPAAGDTVNYLLTVTNNGNATATMVFADDNWPLGLAFVGATSSQGAVAITGTGLSWDIGSLDPNATSTLSVAMSVGSNQAGNTIPNTATVSSTLGSFVDPTPNDNSSTATLTVQAAGNNGGGNGGGGNNLGNGPIVAVGAGGPLGGGQVLGASTTTVPTSTGQVLGASTSCGYFLTAFIKPMSYKGSKNNDPAQVKKLQQFLNDQLGLTLPITGYYGPASEAAVRQFQTKYSTEVLAPWVPYGLPNAQSATGYVYKTTQRWINMISCSTLDLPLPQLP